MRKALFIFLRPCLAILWVVSASAETPFQINSQRIADLAGHLRQLEYRPAPYEPLAPLTGPDRDYHVANFIFFMVAIDHDTQRDGIRYEAEIDGRRLHGSDLLYALAEQAKLKDPDLFLAERFTRIGSRDLRALFCTTDGVCPHDIDGRARIFRSTARYLQKHFAGDARNLLTHSPVTVAGKQGLFVQLERMSAYRDPTRKKANLLVKLLKRAQLVEIIDPQNLDVASDHVVMTMALRSGVVKVASPDLMRSLVEGKELSSATILALRETAKDALAQAASQAQVDVDLVDDLFWSYGRKSLRQQTPLTEVSAVHSELDPHVNPQHRNSFLSFLNGLDRCAQSGWSTIRTVQGPFTRFY